MNERRSGYCNNLALPVALIAFNAVCFPGFPRFNGLFENFCASGIAVSGEGIVFFANAFASKPADRFGCLVELDDFKVCVYGDNSLIDAFVNGFKI